MFVVLAYALGHLVQFAAKYTIEPLVKRIFWNGSFFSEWFLVKGHSACSEKTRKSYIEVARRGFNFPEEVLSLLELPQGTPEEITKAREVSQDVYRRFDSYAMDKGLAVKATTQNAFYAFFRGLALVSLVGGVLFLSVAYGRRDAAFALVGLALLASTAAFMQRARERGQFYIRGLFDSVATHFSTTETAR